MQINNLQRRSVRHTPVYITVVKDLYAEGLISKQNMENMLNGNITDPAPTAPSVPVPPTQSA